MSSPLLNNFFLRSQEDDETQNAVFQQYTQGTGVFIKNFSFAFVLFQVILASLYEILIILSLLQSPLCGWFLNFLSLVGVMSLLKPVSSEYFFLFPESSVFLLVILIYYVNWKKDQHWLAELTSYYIHLWGYFLTKEKQQNSSCTW